MDWGLHCPVYSLPSGETVMFQKMESCPSVRCPWSLARDSWKSLAPLVVECYDTIALCCWQMYFQVLQPDLKAVEKLAWMIPFLQVHAGTRRVWQPGRPLGPPVVHCVVNIISNCSKDVRLVCLFL